MTSRGDLQTILESILGSGNVYYQPPENFKIAYPAIVYSKNKINTEYANDKGYKRNKCYEIVVISKTPDSSIIDAILELPMTTYDKYYTSNNLNHDVITIYV